jgi:hypothetical protein
MHLRETSKSTNTTYHKFFKNSLYDFFYNLSVCCTFSILKSIRQRCWKIWSHNIHEWLNNMFSGQWWAINIEVFIGKPSEFNCFRERKVIQISILSKGNLISSRTLFKSFKQCSFVFRCVGWLDNSFTTRSYFFMFRSLMEMKWKCWFCGIKGRTTRDIKLLSWDS